MGFTAKDKVIGTKVSLSSWQGTKETAGKVGHAVSTAAGKVGRTTSSVASSVASTASDIAKPVGGLLKDGLKNAGIAAKGMTRFHNSEIREKMKGKSSRAIDRD